MAVSAGRLFTLEKRTVNGVDREFCIALDANTGEALWGVDVDAADYSDLAGYDNRMDGPRSTPTIDGDQVYVFTSQLKLYGLAAADGNIVWQRDFRAELGSTVIAWENTASPLLAGELLYVNSNASGQRLMAIRKSDGTTAWSGQDDAMTHATPVFARIDDVPQILFLTRSGLVSLAPEAGQVLWRLGFSPSPTSTAASPAVVGNHVYASAAYGSGTWMGRVARNDGSFTAELAWRQQGTAYQAHWSTPVSHEGFLYGIPSPTSSQARLACLDVAAGSNRWTQTTVGSGNVGFGSVLKAADTLIVLTEAGELVLVQPNPEAYTELARFKALDLYCWNQAALSNGRLYARNTSLRPEIVALDIALPAAPLPALNLAAEQTAESSLKLTVRASPGATLVPTDAPRLELLSSSGFAPLAEWSLMPQTFTAADGTLITEVPIGGQSAQYFRVRARAGSN